MTWANREIDWYNSERRFIFSTDLKEGPDKWIKFINQESVKLSLFAGIMAIQKKNRRASELPFAGLAGIGSKKADGSSDGAKAKPVIEISGLHDEEPIIASAS